MKESKLDRQTRELILANGGYAVKVHSANVSGVSDILACINGRFCSLEDKLFYNKLSKLQVAHQIEVIKAGGLAIENKSLDDVLRVIEWANSGYVQPIPKSMLAEFTL